MEPPVQKRSDKDQAGGCSYGCAILFILAGLVWPLWHLLSGSYEPEIMAIPGVVGVPCFLAAHLLALISISKQPPNHSSGAHALKWLWRAVGVAIVIVVLAIIKEQF